MLGLVAGSGRLPIPLDCYREATRAGVAAEANLRGFEAGLALAATPQLAVPATSRPAGLRDEAAASLPPEVLAVADIALPRLAEYQSEAYAHRYMERLRAILAVDPAPSGTHRLSAEVARHLALWMAYEDVIRVAQLKSSSARFAELRTEMRARPHEPVQVTEFLKPGVEEVASLLPPALGRGVLGWAERAGRTERAHVAMRVRSDTVLGFLRLFLLARLRRWRPRSLRFAEEQAAIHSWLARIAAAAQRGEHTLALEITACARLLKGYGETHRRGRHAFALVMAQAVDSARPGDPAAAGRVAQAREAALADPEHRTLATTLAAIAAEAAPSPLARAAE